MQFVNIEVIFPLIIGLALIIFLIGLSVVKVLFNFGKLEAIVNYYRDRTLPLIQQSLITYHLVMRVVKKHFSPDECLALKDEIELFFYDQYSITKAVESIKETGQGPVIPVEKEILAWVSGLIETNNVFFDELMALVPTEDETIELELGPDEYTDELTESGDSTDKQD